MTPSILSDNNIIIIERLNLFGAFRSCAILAWAPVDYVKKDGVQNEVVQETTVGNRHSNVWV